MKALRWVRGEGGSRGCVGLKLIAVKIIREDYTVNVLCTFHIFVFLSDVCMYSLGDELYAYRCILYFGRKYVLYF